MTPALFAGLGIGAGLVLIFSGLRPLPVPLNRALADLHRGRPETLGGSVQTGSFLTRTLGSALAPTTYGRRLATSMAADLRVSGTTPAEHLAQRAAFTIVAALWVPLVATVMWVGGVDTGVVFPLWGSIALAPVGFLYPAGTLRSRAADRRRSFRHAFSSFLDVVSISLAGGRGVDSALHSGADAGQGWAFDELRRALMGARMLGETPWAGLGRLGGELGIPELAELAASAALAGNEGARVRASLAAKAQALRLRGLSEIEAAAQSATERMTLPVVLLLVGFIVFLIYPAINQVLNGI